MFIFSVESETTPETPGSRGTTPETPGSRGTTPETPGTPAGSTTPSSKNNGFISDM